MSKVVSLDEVRKRREAAAYKAALARVLERAAKTDG